MKQTTEINKTCPSFEAYENLKSTHKKDTIIYFLQILTDHVFHFTFFYMQIMKLPTLQNINILDGVFSCGNNMAFYTIG